MNRKVRTIVCNNFFIAGLTLICVSWLVSVNEWNAGETWADRRTMRKTPSTMKTIIGYSEGKLAEMERPSPVTCNRLPVFPRVPFHSNIWNSDKSYKLSWQPVTGTKVSLYAAYYDDRTPQKYIRILGMFQGRNFSTEETLYCQTRSFNPKDDFIEVVAARPLEIWWHKWDRSSIDVETPVLLSCPLTEELINQAIVSIVTEPCDDPANGFFIQPTTEIRYKRKFTICVKDMNFEDDISLKLVEWIETNRILGVDLIDIYVDKVTLRTEKVLEYYRDKDFVRLFNVPIRGKSHRRLWQRRRDHIVTYNDCLYRNIKETEYIIPLDIDEIIIPKKTKTLSELLLRFKEIGYKPTEVSSIAIRNVFFFDFLQPPDMKKLNRYSKNIYVKPQEKIRALSKQSFEEYSKVSNEVIGLEDSLYREYKNRCLNELPVPMLSRHVISSAIISPKRFYTKSIMMTQKVLTAFNHYPLANLNKQEGILGWSAPISEVQVNHYKQSCDPELINCELYTKKKRIDISALHLHGRLIEALRNAICV